MAVADPLLWHASGTTALVLWRRREGGGDYQVRAVPSSEAATWARGMRWVWSRDDVVLLVAVRTVVSEPAETEVFCPNPDLRRSVRCGGLVCVGQGAVLCRLVGRCGGGGHDVFAPPDDHR
jgi:hypothetical protein